MLSPTFSGESKNCCRAFSASEVMNSLLTAPSEKILSSSVSALGEHGDEGQKGVHVVGSGKYGKRIPFRSIFGVLHLALRLIPEDTSMVLN